ncbi:uncharacterized protein [Phaenicophaeus curvirostris]|uniref:uncharacterized protein isoform X2 n=1 Tax=Phaenicophaeus curvirostris TaxID=33595 RepID=UPI0037F0D0B2
MREPLQDPDPSSGRGGEVMWRCPPGQQLSERYGAFPSLSYTRGGRRGGRPRVKGKRLPFSPKSQSRECPCCRKPGKSLAEQPCFFKAPYSSVPSRGVTREPGRSVGDERAPAGSRPLPREMGGSDMAVPSRPAAFSCSEKRLPKPAPQTTEAALPSWLGFQALQAWLWKWNDLCKIHNLEACLASSWWLTHVPEAASALTDRFTWQTRCANKYRSVGVKPATSH